MGRNRELCHKTSRGEQEPVCSMAHRNQLSHLEKGTRRMAHFPQLLDGSPGAAPVPVSNKECHHSSPVARPGWMVTVPLPRAPQNPGYQQRHSMEQKDHSHSTGLGGTG